MQLKRQIKFFSYFFSFALLGGCAGDSSNVVYDTFKLAISDPNTLIEQTPLNPNFRYLKVEANGQPALLVLGYVDSKKNSKHDVWYSAFKEVVAIHDGRLANTEGLEVNWSQVELLEAPPLREALLPPSGIRAKRNPQFRYARIRTVMPGYHVNIRETLIMQALDEIPSDAPKQFQDAKSNPEIRWVQETVLVPKDSNNPSLKPLRAIYAMNTKTGQVVYGKQELSPNFFVSWLQWPYPASASRKP